jgi:hypothetical protein
VYGEPQPSALCSQLAARWGSRSRHASATAPTLCAHSRMCWYPRGLAAEHYEKKNRIVRALRDVEDVSRSLRNTWQVRTARRRSSSLLSGVLAPG